MDEVPTTAWPSEAAESQVSKEPSPPLPVPTDVPSSVPGVAVPLDTQMDLDPPADTLARPEESSAPTEVTPDASSSAKNETAVETPIDANGSTSTAATNANSTAADPAAAAAPKADTPSTPGPSSTSQNVEKPPPPTSANEQPAAAAAAARPKLDFASLPTRQYLDQTVVPILLQGLSWLAKTRPEDPVTELSKYLLEHKSEYDSPAPQANRQNSSSDAAAATSGPSQSK